MDLYGSLGPILGLECFIDDGIELEKKTSTIGQTWDCKTDSGD